MPFNQTGYIGGNSFVSPQREALMQEAAERRRIRQTREALHAMANRGDPYIEINGQVYTDPQADPGAVQSQQNAATAALQALDSLSPLIQQGLVGSKIVDRHVGSVLADAYADQRHISSASRELGELRRMTESGRITFDVAERSLRAIEAEYGQATMLRVPGYADMAGLREQFEAEKQQAKSQFAAHYGIPENMVTWDDRAFEPTLDRTALAVEQFRQQKARMAATAAEKQQRAIAQSTKILMDRVPIPPPLESLDRDERRPYNTPAKEADYNRRRAAALQQHNALLVGGRRYSTLEEAEAAANAGAIQIGDIIMIGDALGIWQ